MTLILDYVNTTNLAPPLSLPEANAMAAELEAFSGLAVYPRSISAVDHTLFFLGRQDQQKFLGILTEGPPPDGFSGELKSVLVDDQTMRLMVAPTDNAANAATLRRMLPFLVAQPLGLRKAAGCGDRLGLATPGHVRAIRRFSLAPIFAQQSMRENDRTGRTPQQVMDDAMWGVFQEGWREGFGADADHLKTTDDIDICTAAGYTFYTIDPGEYVDNSANTAPLNEVQQKLKALPWDVLDSDPADLENRLAGRSLELDGVTLTVGREELLRAAAKYGRAVAHTVTMYRYLAQVMDDRPFELEMSVDETETITSLAEHVYIASELKRLGVEWVSLAPRYVGEFEKGVDYIGDPAEFKQSFSRHLAVSKTFGPYKLSLHSGSDKFTIYPVASEVAGDLVHLKTAGTSYLEALRAVAVLNPDLFREIVAFALARYPTDRASYHVSAEVDQVPEVSALPDEELTNLLDNFHAREVLHVTFGSVINHEPFRGRFFDTLRSDEETYYQILERHFEKHFEPFE